MSRRFPDGRDMTERKRQEERFQAFIEQSTDIISVLEPDGSFRFMSPSTERITGYEPEALLGDIAFEHIHPDDRSRVMEKFNDAIAHPEKAKTAEFRFRHRDGSWIWLESIGNNQLDNPAIEGFVVNSRDVTKRKEYEQALERQNERLDEFANVISHDLRNPLNVAQGHVELAAEESESEHLDAATRAHERMVVLIDNLLSLAHAGESISETQAVDVSDLVTACWETVETKSAELDTTTEAVVQADPTRLRQLIENLIRNAVEHGGEDVTVSVDDLDDGFCLEDDGRGIPDGKHEQVFEARYSTTAGGTGFGLNIVKEIADAHDWDIRATKGTDGGARFEITGVDSP